MKHSLVFSTREIKEKGGLAFSDSAPVLQFVQLDDKEPGSLDELVGHSCLSGSCTVNVQFSVGGERILAEVQVQGQWGLTCSRCLEPHSESFENQMEETFPVSVDSIDLRNEVREMIILSFPSKSLCKSSCRGLCPHCGKDLNQAACNCGAPVH